MGYGALAGIPISARRHNLTRVSSVTPTIPQQTVYKMPSEYTPLMTYRRIRRNRTREAILNWKIFSLLMILVCGVLIGIHLLVIEYTEWPVNFPFHLIDRNLWCNGNPFNNTRPLNTSHVSNIILTHTRGDFCHSFRSCVDVINSLQDQNVSDIPFNFLIGGDGKTYEIRGWNYLSGFDFPNNSNSFSVGLIGDFTYTEPWKHQIDEVNALISESIRRRKLNSEYKILGMRESKRDGEKLFKQLETLDGWDGWIYDRLTL